MTHPDSTGNTSGTVSTTVTESVIAFDAIYSGLLSGLSKTAPLPARLIIDAVDLFSGTLNSTMAEHGFNNRALTSATLSFSTAMALTLAAPAATVGGAIVAGTIASWIGAQFGGLLYDWIESGNAAADLDRLSSLGEAMGQAISDAIDGLGDTASDIGKWLSDRAADFGNLFSPDGPFGDLFGPGGPLGSGGPIGDLTAPGGLFAPDGPLADFFGPNGPFGDFFGPDGPIADILPPWFEPNGPFYFPPIDPLVLDLNGDGINIVSIDTSNAYFDFNQDGFAEKTAWIGPDDAFLVYDINGNGQIDDLSEMFGGEETDGFAALALYDTNGDNQIDASDAIYSQLSLWNDANGNGLTEAGELTSLASNGVTSINLTTSFKDLRIGGNWISYESTYQAASGTGSIYNIWFENDQVRTIFEYGDSVEYAANITRLPNLSGYGNLKSLYAAMAADDTLRADVETFVRGAATKSYRELTLEIEAILLKWAGVDGVDPSSRGPNADARHLAFLEVVHGQSYVSDLGGPDPVARAAAGLESYYNQIISAMTARVLVQLTRSAYLIWEDDGAVGAPDVAVGELLSVQLDAQSDLLFGDFEAVFSIMAAEIVQTDGSPDNVDRLVDAAVLVQLLRTDYSAVKSQPLLEVAIGILRTAGVSEGLISLFEIAVPTTPDLMDFGTDGDDIINSNSDANILNGGLGNDELYGNDGSDTYVFTRGDGVDTIEDNGYLDNDRLVLHGYTPAEVLVQRATGGSGFDDLLLTFAGTTDAITIWNTLEDSSLDAIEEIVFDDGTIWTMADLRARIISESQTAGDDVVNGFWYDETLEGGLGNDELYGNDGSDTYVFTRGDGVDTIEDNGYLDNDRLVLHGYTPAEVLVQRATGGSGFDDLLLTFVGTTDAITIGNTLDGDYFDQIEQIVFDDGTVWTMADVDARFVDGTSGADSLVGGVNGDSLDGGAGDDALSGGAGNDLLIGGIGADALDGGDGIDRVSYRNADAGVYVHMGDVAQNTGEAAGDSYVSIEELEGTEFDDTLMGPIGGGSVFGLGGNDAIVGLGGGPNQLFGGDGNDSIYGDAFDDFIEGGAGDDIAFGYEGNDTIDVGPGNDYVVAGTGNDTVTGGLGDDEIHAGEGDDVLVGGDGADLLFGNFGNDVIDPGSGNDFILGGPGDDTFVFRPGLGNNRIDDFAAGAAAGDVIELQGLGVSTFADLQNLMAEWGGTTFIEFDADNSIILGGVSMASLTADDFRFVA